MRVCVSATRALAHIQAEVHSHHLRGAATCGQSQMQRHFRVCHRGPGKCMGQASCVSVRRQVHRLLQQCCPGKRWSAGGIAAWSKWRRRPRWPSGQPQQTPVGTLVTAATVPDLHRGFVPACKLEAMLKSCARATVLHRSCRDATEQRGATDISRYISRSKRRPAVTRCSCMHDGSASGGSCDTSEICVSPYLPTLPALPPLTTLISGSLRRERVHLWGAPTLRHISGWWLQIRQIWQQIL